MSLSQKLERILAKTGLREQPRSGWIDAEIQGLRWRLCLDHYLDRGLYERGVFEEATTRKIRELLKPGMRALDVGANFGYYTLICAQLVGPEGKVWASEPTRYYRERLLEHLQLNTLNDRVNVIDFGFSDHDAELTISIGESSATLHPPDPALTKSTETIRLRRLDDEAECLGIDRLDFVKLDIDGHELAFLDGAGRTLQRLRPVMMVEFSQEALDAVGANVEILRQRIESLGYELRSEKTDRPYASRREFLLECGNFSHSANVWAYPRTG